MDSGTDIHIKNKESKTALNIVRKNKHKDVVEYLSDL